MSETLEVRNPRTGKNDYEICVADDAAIASIAGEMRAAQPDWAASGIEERVRVLLEFSRALEANADAIVSALSTDTGRRAIARSELAGLMGGIERWCAQAPAILAVDERPSAAMPHVALREEMSPYPLLGAISPWNFPLLLSFIDAIPALLAGSAVMIKPSEVTPRFAEPVGAAIADVAELARVLRFVAGDGRTGAALIGHVDVVAFTGSVKTGRKVATAAASAFVPAFLELGGKDPAIVLRGSDLERAATAILRASVAATGQACQSIERIYVHETEHDEFVSLLSSKAEKVALSHPDPSRGVIGPLIFEQQAEIIRAHLDDARARGASVATGGKVETLDGGLWIRPTVLTGVDHGMVVMTDETFGPIMPVMPFSEEEEAVALANDSRYGLSGAVFGPTEEQALAVAKRLDAGGISINDAGLTTMIFEAEKSAFKYSGMGPSRMGASGLTRFLRRKALYMNRGNVLPLAVMAEDA